MITILGKHSQLLDSYILKLGSTWCSIKWLFLVYLNWEWVYEKSLQPHLYKIYLSVGGYVLCCLLCLMLSQRKTQIYNNITLRYASLKEVSISGSNYAFLPVNWSSNGPGRQFPKQNLVWPSWDLPLLICTIATKLLLYKEQICCCIIPLSKFSIFNWGGEALYLLDFLLIVWKQILLGKYAWRLRVKKLKNTIEARKNGAWTEDNFKTLYALIAIV